MNLDIFKQSDPAGKFSKENYVLKNHPEEYSLIIDYCIKNDLNDLPFKEKVFLCINSIKSYPTCKNLNCSNKVKYKNSTIGYNDYCSRKCISSDLNIKRIKQEKSIQKFGTKTPAESELIKNKIIKTNNLKWGFNSPMSSEDIKKKSQQTCLYNYGVKNPAYSTDILSKRIEKFKESSFKENYKLSSINKYGVEHPWKNKQIHDKTIESFYSSYKERILEKIKDLDYNFIRFEFKPTKLIFNCKYCNDDFSINDYQLYYRTKFIPTKLCTKCFPIAENSSLLQLELLDFIREIYNGEIITNTKKIIKPYEIDIYLPELKIGIEFNCIYWHSENFKDKWYHYNKYSEAEKNNINLISIWEDDWNIKKDICKSVLTNKIGKIKDIIYARKCIIKEVSYLESKLFLDKNHLQGNCLSSIRYGLYFNNQLISLMTFGKLRLPLSGKNLDGNNFELIRFVNKIDIICIGGASKLLNYFIKNIKPKSVISYSDNLISKGDLYEKLNFKYSHTSNPGYWYVIDSKREHRFNWRKTKLISMGADKNKTEHQIMSEMGYYKIYNAGNKKWIINLY
jgi:hypothetical protein